MIGPQSARIGPNKARLGPHKARIGTHRASIGPHKAMGSLRSFIREKILGKNAQSNNVSIDYLCPPLFIVLY